MRTRAKKKYVASDRARRERFASETLCSNRKLHLLLAHYFPIRYTAFASYYVSMVKC